ncbi:MAG: ABC-type bacteriocin/lantibiotic exporter with double-glycine peptidase domain [Vicingaceae bacterium]|jgi:ABC-type bacteriocin/lantibiotic exporter with double-glycine peptidase domain
MPNEIKLTPLDRFWKMLKPDQREIKNVYTYAVFNGIINLSLPLGIQAIINLIQGGRLNTSWVILVTLVTLGVAMTGVLQIFQLRIVENLQQKIFTRAAFEFAYRVPRIKMEQLYKEYAPELMNRFFDIITVQKGLSKILIDFTAAGLQIVFGLILLSFYHPFFILFSLLLIVLLYSIFRVTAKKGLETSLLESKSKYKTVHWLEELARTNTTFKLTGKTDLPLSRTNKNVDNYLTAREGHFQILMRQFSLMVMFKVLMTVGLLAIGGILVMDQLMNIGQFVAAEIIILLIMNSVEKLISSLETIYDVLTGIEKVGQVTDLELEKNTGLDVEVECQSPGMQVDLVNLSFKYPQNERLTLKQLNLTIKRGSLVSLVGKNGSGKSTLIRLLAGLYELQSGQILYDEIGKESFSVESLRSAIGDCLSQEELFQGTVFENVTMGKNISIGKVKEICRKVHLTDFINNLGRGYDTELDPQGSGLAESTVQKLLVARAILNAPKLLLVEDNLDAIDDKEKKDIIDFLRDKSNNWTVIAATKNEYLIQKSEQVIELENGNIIYDGTPENYKRK